MQDSASSQPGTASYHTDQTDAWSEQSRPSSLRSEALNSSPKSGKSKNVCFDCMTCKAILASMASISMTPKCTAPSALDLAKVEIVALKNKISYLRREKSQMAEVLLLGASMIVGLTALLCNTSRQF